MIDYTGTGKNHLVKTARGVTVDRAYVLASAFMDAQATYVGMSRHRLSTDLFWSQEQFASKEKLIENLSRDRTKDVTLDYTKVCDELVKLNNTLSLTAPKNEKTKTVDYEQQSALIETQLAAYEKAILKSIWPRTVTNKMNQYTHQIAQQKELMQYLEQTKPALIKTIQEKAQIWQQEKSKARERTG